MCLRYVGMLYWPFLKLVLKVSKWRKVEIGKLLLVKSAVAIVLPITKKRLDAPMFDYATMFVRSSTL